MDNHKPTNGLEVLKIRRPWKRIMNSIFVQIFYQFTNGESLD